MSGNQPEKLLKMLLLHTAEWYCLKKHQLFQGDLGVSLQTSIFFCNKKYWQTVSIWLMFSQKWMKWASLHKENFTLNEKNLLWMRKLKILHEWTLGKLWGLERWLVVKNTGAVPPEDPGLSLSTQSSSQLSVTLVPGSLMPNSCLWRHQAYMNRPYTYF